MYEWTLQYEQSVLNEGLGVYKFEQEPIHDGDWHLLNSSGIAHYRIADDIIQFIVKGEGLSQETYDELKDTLKRIGPIDTEDSVEILIRKKADSYDMWSHWVLQQEGVPLRAISAQDIKDAYARLRKLEDSF
jgi:hypothetical protein